MSHVFRPGDKVKCAFYGDEVFTLMKHKNDDYPIYFIHRDAENIFTSDGKYYANHTHPVLTLVEAKKEPMRIECEVEWKIASGGRSVSPFEVKQAWDVGNRFNLLGKRGRLTFVESEGE